MQWVTQSPSVRGHSSWGQCHGISLNALSVQGQVYTQFGRVGRRLEAFCHLSGNLAEASYPIYWGSSQIFNDLGLNGGAPEEGGPPVLQEL